MSVWGRARAKWDELWGRAEELYGESHGDSAAEVHGEAVRTEGEVAEEVEERKERLRSARRPEDEQPA
jgi:uncharacterized protein YjbJ (UPF0337 family)